MNNKNDYNIQVNFIENNSIDSIDDDFQTSGKYLQFNSDTNRIETVNPKVELAKKNTKISSNIDEDQENGNLINNGKIYSNNTDIQLPFSENKKNNGKSRNENINDRLDSPTGVINMTNYKFSSPEESKINNIKMSNFSPKKILGEKDIINVKVTEESISYNDMKNNIKLKTVSKDKNKKQKLLVLEEKNKYKSYKTRFYSIKESEDKKEDDKIVRRDKNGVQICKKNKKKVKISFEIPFEIITPVESYKKYNVIVEIPNEDNYMKECKCCSLF